MPLQIAYSYLSGGVFILVETDDASRQHEIHVGPLLLSTHAGNHRRNFVCDDSDLSPPLLKVVVTVTTTFSKWNLQFFKQFYVSQYCNVESRKLIRWITAQILLLFKCLGYMYHEEQGCIFSYKNTIFFLYFGQDNRIFLATRCVLWPKMLKMR